MSIKNIQNIQNILEQSLLKDGEMYYSLYEYELEELQDKLKLSLAADKDELIFAVTEHSGHSAMLLIDCNGNSYINEEARIKLKEYWKNSYNYNMDLLIPVFAKQLNNGDIPVNGVKIQAEFIA